MLKKVLSLFMASFFAIVLFELFLRYSPYSYGISPVVYDKDLGMWHKKNFSSTSKKECYNTRYYFDKNGLVKNAYEFDENKEDILVFGDSYIEALMVQNENVIHNKLYSAYEGKYNFLNYGMSGSSVVQQFVTASKKVDFSRSKVLLQFIRIESDIYDVDPRQFNGSTRPKVMLDFEDLENFKVIEPKSRDYKEVLRDTLGSLELYVFIRKGVYFLKKKYGKSKKEKEAEKAIRDVSENWVQIKGAIWQLKKLLKEKGVSYKVLLYGKNRELTTVLKAFLEDKEIAYIDLLEVAKDRGLTIKGFTCDKHWSDQTHKNVAKLIKSVNLVEQ